MRLSIERIEGTLARLRVGSPLTDSELRRYLFRAVIATTVIATVVVTATVALAALTGTPTTTDLLIEEWAGVLLVMGVLSAGSTLSVAGVATPLLAMKDESSGWALLRERLRSWQQTWFVWVWRTVVAVILLSRPLLWLSNWIGASEAAQSVWHFVGKIFGFS